jgi:choline-glycine betaine transporter
MQQNLINNLINISTASIIFFLICSIIPIYIILSIWYNTRETKKNTDKIVKILKSYTKQEITEEQEINEENWVDK